MSDRLKTEGVDISPEAVERAASGAELNGQRWLAEMLRELSRSLTARDDALASIRVFAQDCIENSHDRGHLGNLYSIRDLCDSKGETK